MLSTQSFVPALVKMIREEIRTRGPQSFAWFMAQALYHPEHGYYSTDRAAIGRRGDYFTNVSVGPLFGELLAAQFVEIWERLGQIENFLIVEQGAHHGQFARDVLESTRRRSPEFFSGLRYQIVEPFSALQDRQSQGLKEFREVLRVRAKHRALGSPFDEIGEADITAHVNWTDLAERAQANGLRVAGFTDQHHFLTGIISEFGRGGPPAPPANASPARTDWGQSPLPSDSKTKRALQTLLHPEMLGRSFQVLALEKDVDLAERLSGFKFARNPCQALGL